MSTALVASGAGTFCDGVEVNMDAEAGFTARDFRDSLEAQGITIRVKYNIYEWNQMSRREQYTAS